MTIKANWENPFPQEASSMSPVAPPFTGRASADIERIKEEQRKLLPVLNDIYEIAAERLDAMHPFDKSLYEKGALINIVYRLPDSPDILTSMHVQISTHTIPFIEDEPISRHPLVAKLCPSMPYYSLPVQQRMLIEGLVVLAQGEMTIPKASAQARAVQPELLHYVMHWIENIDGPINGLAWKPLAPPHSRSIHQEHSLRLN